MSTTEDLADAISAASLVLAVLAALYTLWLPEVSAALDITPRADRDDRAPQRAQVVTALLTKALPLSIASISATAILMPRGFAIIAEAWEHHAEWAFDDVKAFFVLTFALMLTLAGISATQFIRLVSKRIELDQ
ncbi:hypothetical protein CN150_27900 [Sinorhizobium meliloti]|uniref:hypothetical protein n=1 Tax=Rhizobium meliloti TaxID=382 RepID=UPI000FE02F0E|nr:hypothetical protein [Sinorhizobium meliloti]RVK90427.1 hypothetical protein CN150_27900 [Sinorhizobium meliloti]